MCARMFFDGCTAPFVLGTEWVMIVVISLMTEYCKHMNLSVSYLVRDGGLCMIFINCYILSNMNDLQSMFKTSYWTKPLRIWGI